MAFLDPDAEDLQSAVKLLAGGLYVTSAALRERQHFGQREQWLVVRVGTFARPRLLPTTRRCGLSGRPSGPGAETIDGWSVLAATPSSASPITKPTSWPSVHRPV